MEVTEGGVTLAIPEARHGEPWCMWIIDTHGHYADGRTRVLTDERPFAVKGTGAACLCLSEEELETEARHDELNDKALAVCELLVAEFDFDWDECQMDHDSGRWFDFVFPSAGVWGRAEGDALGCVGEP